VKKQKEKIFIFTKLTTRMVHCTQISKKENNHYFVSSHGELVRQNILDYALSYQSNKHKVIYFVFQLLINYYR